MGLPGFGVAGLGCTLEAALRNPCAEIAWLWWEYAGAPEEELGGDARDLARRLREAAGFVAGCAGGGPVRTTRRFHGRPV